jgi:class 3 adenylate cyclase
MSPAPSRLAFIQRAPVILLAAFSTAMYLLWVFAWTLPSPEVLAEHPNLARMASSPGGMTNLAIKTALVVVTGLLLNVVAIVLAWRGYESPLARLLAIACVLRSAVWSYGIARVSLGATHPAYAVFAVLDVLTPFVAAAAHGYLYRFLRRFPVEVQVEDARTGAGLGLVNARIIRALDRNWVLYSLLAAGALLQLLGSRYFPDVPLSLLAPIGGAIFLAIGIEGLGATMHNCRHSLAAKQSGYEWLYFGFWAALLLYLFLFLSLVGMSAFQWSDAVARYATHLAVALFPLVQLGIVALIVVSIFHHGTLEPRLVVRRASIAAFLLGLIGVLFVLIERLAVQYAARILGLSDEAGWVVAAAIACAAGLHLRKFVDRALEKYLDWLSEPRDLADGKRVQAVVVFSDLSGFTKLSAEDERSALIAAALLHKVARKAGASHRGRLVKTIGDAVLLQFAVADEAIAATREIHAVYERESAILGLPALAVHSGIHSGEVIVGRDGDLYGATVNLAARLQDAATSGEIVVSDGVRSLATSSRWHDLGAKNFKNIPDAVTCARLLMASDAIHA